MHWNQSDAIDRLDSREAVIILRDGAKLSRNDFSVDAIDDLLRSALVLGVSALDRYVHERVIRGIVKALRKPDLNQTQEEFSIPASLSLEITQALQDAARKKYKLRPANEIRNKVQDILHTRPFQSWREIQFAFELLGITNLAGQNVAEDIRDVFVRNFHFGCEADDPANAGAFDSRHNPLGARLPAIFSSDIGHWDVLEMRGVLHEAWELVEDGLLTRDDFRDFTFGNAARMWAGANPRFFEGTSVDSAVAALLA